MANINKIEMYIYTKSSNLGKSLLCPLRIQKRIPLTEYGEEDHQIPSRL